MAKIKKKVFSKKQKLGPLSKKQKLDNLSKKQKLGAITKRHRFGIFLKKNYGLGSGTRDYLSVSMGLNPRFRQIKLKKRQVSIINKKSHNMYFGAIMKENLRSRIIAYIRLKTYRGIRHQLKLPSHGQRTHTNGKTKKKFRY